MFRPDPTAERFKERRLEFADKAHEARRLALRRMVGVCGLAFLLWLIALACVAGLQ